MVYLGYKATVRQFIQDAARQLSLGSDILVEAYGWAGSIYWTKARPSTVANVLLLLCASGEGLDIESKIIQARITTKPTLTEWTQNIREKWKI